MYQHIMVPVDLTHLEALEKALVTATDLARHYSCPVTYVGVAASTPGALGHNPHEFGESLAEFGRAEAGKRGVDVRTKAVISHDPTSDLDDALVRAAQDLGADLVVMATHHPTIVDYLWPSNGGRMANHSDLSVFLVRGA